eukprot:m.146460 g.146460  ORF g.146460 m.146460 type:complete len:635 (+) comp14145_c0_seq3:132-2036(+)
MHCGCTRRLAAVRRHLASAPHRKYDWSTIRPPPLPLPPLEDTISRYLEQLKPLLSTESHAEAAREAAEFERVLGKDLQQQLKRSVEADRTTSYVKPFWDAMYLGGRYPVVINSNPFVAWHPHPDPTQQSQATRTAGLVHKMLTWRQGMENGLVEPDGPAEPPNRRLCMTEYEKLFCTSRIPVVGGPDVHLTEPSARHIVVLRGAAVYKLNVVRDDGRISSERAIETAMAEILEFPTERDPSAAVATLTAADRDHWGRARTSLLEADPANKVGLNTIESAILHVCLDQTVPTNRKEVYETFLYGGKNGESRWYDKSVSLICTPSGDAAVNFEHSPFDGSTLIRMMNDVWHMAAGLSSGKDVPSTAAEDISWTPRPERVALVMSPEVRGATQAASASFGSLKGALNVSPVHFDDFGAAEIRGWGRDYGPDGVLHMAFQLAYGRIHKRHNISVYSAASTKAFLRGRTEAARCATAESVALAQHFSSTTGREARRELLRAAVRKHRAMSKEAGKGLGVDRHLFSLSCLAANRAPHMFGTAWAAHQKSTLSTSNCSVFGPSIITPGFGAVCDDGYGLGYVIGADAIDVCITNFTASRGTGGAGFGGVKQAVNDTVYNTDAARLGSEIATALREFRELFA